MNFPGWTDVRIDISMSAPEKDETRPGEVVVEGDLPGEDPAAKRSADASRVAVPAAEQSLVPVDPLRKYLWEIRMFPELTAEEEKELAQLSRRGDQEATARLITSNLRLVVRIAFMYNRVYSNTLDLIQEGSIGLVEAVRRFDPFKGARLPTYATWWIKAYVIKFLLDNFRIVRVGTTNERRRLLFNLRKEKEKLRLQGIEPTHQLMAEKLNVSIEDVRAIDQAIEGGDVSLDSPPPGDNFVPLSERLSTAEERVDDQLARGELKEAFNRHLAEFAANLSDRETVILQKRLIAEEPLTLQALADRYGVTREAIRLNEKSLIRRIKVYMEEALQDVTDVEFSLFD